MKLFKIKIMKLFKIKNKNRIKIIIMKIKGKL